MITLRRLNGSTFALNCDLIERIETTPDTVIVLLDGSRYVVGDPIESVIELVRNHRAEVVALCHRIEQEVAHQGLHGGLRLVTPEEG